MDMVKIIDTVKHLNDGGNFSRLTINFLQSAIINNFRFSVSQVYLYVKDYASLKEVISMFFVGHGSAVLVFNPKFQWSDALNEM